jgi:hypothetical protein
MLFSVTINDLPQDLRNADRNNTSPKISNFKMNSLLFADDTAAFHRRQEVLQEMINAAAEWARRRGQRFAPEKSVVVGRGRINIKMEGVQLEQRSDTTYLGIIMTASGVDMAALSLVFKHNTLYSSILG